MNLRLAAGLLAAALAALPVSPAGAEVIACSAYRYLSGPPSPSYPDRTGAVLTDGSVGSPDFTDGSWAGFTENPVIEFQFDKEYALDSVEVVYDVAAGPGLGAPAQIAVFVSTDGTHFTRQAAAVAFDRTEGVHRAAIPLYAASAGRVRIEVTRGAQWLFLSEVTFRGAPAAVPV